MHKSNQKSKIKNHESLTNIPRPLPISKVRIDSGRGKERCQYASCFQSSEEEKRGMTIQVNKLKNL